MNHIFLLSAMILTWNAVLRQPWNLLTGQDSGGAGQDMFYVFSRLNNPGKWKL